MSPTPATAQMPRNVSSHGPIDDCAERVHRVDDARAGEERAEDREAERRDHERQVPDAQHPAPFLHHHRVDERGRGEPRQQRRVLDRVPAPVAAPAEHRVAPPRAEHDADGEEAPRDERRAAHVGQPALAEAAGDERGDRERERDREARRSPRRASAGGSRRADGSGAAGSGPARRAGSCPVHLLERVRREQHQGDVDVEVVGAGLAAGPGHEGDIDVLPVAAGLVDPLPEVVEHAGEVLGRLQHRRLGGAGERGRSRERVPAVAHLGHPPAGQLAVAPDPDRHAARLRVDRLAVGREGRPSKESRRWTTPRG